MKKFWQLLKLQLLLQFAQLRPRNLRESLRQGKKGRTALRGLGILVLVAWVAGVTETEPANADASSKGILVIDELGRLELLHGGGLTNALALVERGATPALPHALIVVREQLLEQAKERFAYAPWGGMTSVFPVGETRAELLARCI